MESFEELIDGLNAALGLVIQYDETFIERALVFAIDWLGMNEEEVRTYLESFEEQEDL